MTFVELIIAGKPKARPKPATVPARVQISLSSLLRFFILSSATAVCAMVLEPQFDKKKPLAKA